MCLPRWSSLTTRTRLSAKKRSKARENPCTAQKSLNINEEYLNTLRTQSYAPLFTKTQQFAAAPSDKLEALLEPEQDLIPSMLLPNLIYPKALSDIDLVMASYFDTSAEASEICKQLLRNIKITHGNYQSMDNFLASFSDSSPNIFALSNPFSSTNRSNFREIHDKYSSILQTIKLRHKKVTRKLKLLRCIKKLSRACLMVACGAMAAVAIGIAVHTFFGFLLGPALMGLSPMALKKGLSRLRRSKTQFLMQLQEQLDTAAKGAYILGRDLDTVSQLVARLSDGIERENAMARYCMERVQGKYYIPVLIEEVVKELRRSCYSSRRLVEELEEHVCLCLATINKARVLVIKQIIPS